MPTRARHLSILDRRPLPKPQTRAAGEQLIPLTDYLPARKGSGGRLHYNRSNYDAHSPYLNQIELYDKFKLDVLSKKAGSELQDIIATTGTVSAARDAYISTCATNLNMEPGPDDGMDLYAMLFEAENMTNTLSQIFDMLFLRGGVVVEMKFQRKRGKYIPLELVTHDPKRFDFEEQEDPRVRDGQKWQLGLTSRDTFQFEFTQLDNPAVQYIAWRPKTNEKPFGRSRVGASTYYAATLVQTIRLVTKILSKSGSPVLPITIDKQKLFGGPQNMTPLYAGDIDAYIKQQAADLRKVIPKLGEDDALILTGECILGEYLTPGARINIEGLEGWSDKLRHDILWSMNTPPAVIGIVQKSAALDDNNTRFLIKNYKNGCGADQRLVASGLEPIFAYGMRLNNIRKRKKLRMWFDFNNVEEVVEKSEIAKKKAESMKATMEWIALGKENGVLDDMEARMHYETELENLEMMA